MSENEALAPLHSSAGVRLNPQRGSIIDLRLESSDHDGDLRAHWRVVVDHIWTILASMCVVATVAAIISFKMKPVYVATARVEVEAETPEIQSLNDLFHTLPTDDTFLETQVNVLKSDNLAWHTIEQFGLAANPEFVGKRTEDHGELGNSPDSDEGRLVALFGKRLDVRLIRRSRMVEIGYESADRHLAQKIVNALVNNYVEYNFQNKYYATRQASGWIAQQLDELKAKVEQSQQALVNYERQNSIVNVGEKQNVVEQRLADLSRDLTDAENDRLQKESRYKLGRSDERQGDPLTQNELQQRLEEKYADLKSQYVEALNQYGPKFPKVLRLEQQAGEIQSFIDREHRRVADQIRNDYEAAMGREKLLSEAVAREKAQVGALNQLLIQHNMLKREYETNQQLYDSLSQHLKDATVSAGLRASNIHVVDSAIVPNVPVRPKKLLNISLALLAGLFLGIGVAYLEESLDNSVKTVQHVEMLTGAPVLASVPKVASNDSRSQWLKGPRANTHPKDAEAEMVVLKAPASAPAESYLALRTSILLSTASGPPQAVLVTSPNPNEGKSCTSLNLALALAQRGGRVLVIDSDLRKPGIAQRTGLTNEKGLSSHLAGAHGLDEVLCQFETMPNLWILPAGPPAPNPAELLSSPAMEKVLREARQRFDHLVLDTPPALMFTDAVILSSLVDGVLIVVESGMTARGSLVRANKVLQSAGGKILGVVMNKVNTRTDGYYYLDYYGRYGYSTPPNGNGHGNGNGNGNGNGKGRVSYPVSQRT